MLELSNMTDSDIQNVFKTGSFVILVFFNFLVYIKPFPPDDIALS